MPAGIAIVGRRLVYIGSRYGITVLSESLPPERYTTTRLRDGTPWAKAMSHNTCGAAKPKVKAVTPPLTNCRLEKFMTASS